jgi:tetratricopeptide (TPR) repeat protein
MRIARKALESFPPGSAPAIEARLCRGIAGGARNLPAPAIRAIAERAVALYRELDDPQGLAEALRSLAQIIGWYFRAERVTADALACESIEIARGLDNPLQLALSLRTRGLTIDISDFPQKRAVLEECLALIRRYGNDWQTGNTLTWISDLEFSAGDWPRALEYGREAVRFAERAASRQLYVSSMSNLAAYAGALGDWETARFAIGRSIAMCRNTHQQEFLSFMAQAAAVVALGTGRAEDAARLIGWCDARVGTLHPTRQADQSEDICHRHLMKDLRERLGKGELAHLMSEGTALSEKDALALALAV